jgi:extracellular elastinolytic metalloproteinase
MAGKRSAWTRTAGVVTAASVVLALGLAGAGGAGAAAAGTTVHHGRSAPDDKQDFDARQGSRTAAHMVIPLRAAKASSRTTTQALRHDLGRQAVVEMDGTTGTARIVERLDGTLTGRSSAAARTVAMRYVDAHLSALGLERADLSTFRLRRDYVDIAGIHHLSWTQVRGGVPVFGNGLQANVTRDGRLLSIGGSPVSGLVAPPVRMKNVDSRTAAISAARADLGEPRSAGTQDTAKQVLFVTPTGTHLGWQVVTMSASKPALTVVDAHTGSVLFRNSLSDDANSTAAHEAKPKPASTGLAFRYFPRHVPGGTPRLVNFTKKGWLGRHATKLKGNNSHAFSDVNDDDRVEPSEEVPPLRKHSWAYRLHPFHLKNVSFCDNPFPCTWNPNVPFSWKKNRKQNTTQVFFFVNKWHDHLQADPIGFTEAAGNFQRKNTSRHGLGGDAVATQTEDGANTDAGLPDGGHIDNANMSTPPDGQAPTMQMFLQHQPGTTYPDGDPFAPTDVGDEADTVYHEYTHGLSNRLVVDAAGDSTLGDVQAGAMGEAWSDWYAMDYLVAHGLQRDRPNKVDVILFQFDGEGVALDRTEPVDCKVGSTARRCNGGTTGHLGGYTYADYGHVVGQPEVHGDGEIWAQTLWDLRDKLGSKKAESLVTRAMELSPANPSFIDERNAILLADTALFHRLHHDAIWRVFAKRGMGFFAGSLGGDDASPGADFHTPPAAPETATIHGTVTDADTGAPVGGATVALAFQGTPGSANPVATTGPDGSYTLGPVPVGTYPKLTVLAPGFDPTQTSVTVVAGGTTKDLQVRRDWAASSGGGSIADFNGPDFGPACGPEGAIDLSQGTGWGTTTGDDDGTATNVFVPKHIVIELPQAVDVSEFAVDPSATCGDGGSASTGGFTIETSPDNVTYTPAADGTFTADDRGTLVPITPTDGATGVKFVRFTITSNQTPDFETNCPAGAFSGCSFTDLTEIEVYGAPAG